MIDLIILAHGRPEFTAASTEALLKHTLWGLVDRVHVYFDGVPNRHAALFVLKTEPETHFHHDRIGGPVEIMKHYLAMESEADIFIKIDNDCIVPKGWLNRAAEVMLANPDLDLLGIEPPSSTVRIDLSNARNGYAPTDAIGGIGLMRRRAFTEHKPMGSHSGGRGGFTDWQLANPDVKKGWLAPPLSLFLLDRMTTEPWISYSRNYTAEGLQRDWKKYTEADAHLWNWWEGK